MYYDKASKYVQMRFKRQGICMICQERIKDYESFEYIAVRVGREKLYNFFHTCCLSNRTNRVRMADVDLDREGV